MQKQIDKKAFLLLIVLSFIWGYNWVVMKKGISYMPDLYFAFFRAFFGSLLLFGILAFNKKSLKIKHVKYTSILGILQTTGFVGFTLLALRFGEAGKTAILVYSMPFWLMVLSWKILKEKSDKIEILSNILAFLGLFFVLKPWNMNLSGGALGDVLAILSALSWAFSVIWQKLHMDLNKDIIAINAWQMIIGSSGLLALAFLLEHFYIKFSYYLLFAILYNAVLGNALAWIIWSYAIKRLPPGIMGLTMLLAPIIGMVSSMLELGEKMGIYEAFGSFLIVLGLLITTIDRIRKY